MEPDNEKACPFCAETIKAAAIVCKHCGRDLPALPKRELSETELSMTRLGIERDGERYVWRGNHFKRLSDALAFAERNAQAVSPHVPSQAPSEQRPFKWWLWGPVGAAGLFVVWALARTPSPEEVEKRRAEGVIEYCWQEQGRKSLDPAAARFAASTCEKLTDDFRSKYGHNP